MAQETYSIAVTSPANVAKLDLGRVQQNTATCKSKSLPATCTQADICVAANVSGGAACTVVDANAAGVRIYANTVSGREAFMALALLKPRLDDFVEIQAALGMQGLRAFCLAGNQAAKDGICTASGQAAGCGICDGFQ
jgi:hypothetical protein